MPSARSDRGDDLPALLDPLVAKALSRVLRQHILLAASEREVSAGDVAEGIGVEVSHVAYHMRVLREECGGLLRATRNEQRRGAIQHYYRADVRTMLTARELGEMERGMGALLGAAASRDLLRDISAATEVGSLAAPSAYLFRTPLSLDSEGREKVRAIAERAAREAEAEQVAASERAARRDAEGEEERAAGYVFAAMAFEPGWQPLEPRG